MIWLQTFMETNTIPKFLDSFYYEAILRPLFKCTTGLLETSESRFLIFTFMSCRPSDCYIDPINIFWITKWINRNSYLEWWYGSLIGSFVKGQITFDILQLLIINNYIIKTITSPMYSFLIFRNELKVISELTF